MGFPLDAVVNVEQVDDKNWKLRRALEYEATGKVRGGGRHGYGLRLGASYFRVAVA